MTAVGGGCGSLVRPAVQDWLFEVHLWVAESVNTMSWRYDPAAVAALPAAAFWNWPVTEYVNVALTPAKTPVCEAVAANEPSRLIAVFRISR